MSLTYAQGNIPPNYKCGNCGATNCKLWRLSHSDDIHLLCAPCAAKNQGKSVETLNLEGDRHTKWGWTDTIGWYVPAVPQEEGDYYWGYSSVPDAGVNWWIKLPTFPQSEP